MRDFFLITIGLCLMPLLAVLVSSGLADLLGCTLNMAEPHPCPLLGLDLGALLYTLQGLGYVMIVSIPLAAILSIAWLVLEGLRWMRAGKEERKER